MQKRGRDKHSYGVYYTYPFNDRISIKEPAHMAEPEPFSGAMRVSLRITKLVMVSMCAYPIYWVSLHHHNKTKNKSMKKDTEKEEWKGFEETKST